MVDIFVGRRSELEILKRELIEKHHPVAIHGQYGTGKTTLAHFFAETHKDSFPGGIYYTYPYGQIPLKKYIERNIVLPVNKPALLVIDESEALRRQDFGFLRDLPLTEPLLSILVLGVGPQIKNTGFSSIELKGLSKSEFSELLKKHLDNFQPEIAEKFYDFVKGNPALVDAAMSSVREGLFVFSKLFDAFSDFSAPGILGPDGKPFFPEVTAPSKLITDVRGVNEELLSILKSDPELLRKIPPRKFEEIVAELLSRQGYTVELTPASRDGGFDMYAGKSDGLGTFLFLVECKRHTPPSKVGVQVVRALYGNVQRNRATAGIIATTSFFTPAAKEFQREIKYQLQLRDFFKIKKWLGLL
ncbi:restriction endonuclease [Thermodesulfobacteriota bacterium]